MSKPLNIHLIYESRLGPTILDRVMTWQSCTLPYYRRSKQRPSHKPMHVVDQALALYVRPLVHKHKLRRIWDPQY